MRACSSHPFDKTGCKVTESFLFITFRQKSIVCTLREIHLAKLVSMLRRTFPFAFVKTSLVDLHPEVFPSATEVGYQWIALVSNKLDKVAAHFLQRLDVSAILEYFGNTLRHILFLKMYFYSVFFAYFWLNRMWARWKLGRAVSIWTWDLCENASALATQCNDLLKDQEVIWWMEREIGLESRFSIWDLLHRVHGGLPL